MFVHGHVKGRRDDSLAPFPTRYRIAGNQRGVFAPMTGVLLTLIFGLCAMALGLSQLYNRKIEMQAIANSVALAAARELDGTNDGMTVALQKAATTAKRFTVNYKDKVVWSDDAISFSGVPTGDWVAPGGGDPAKMFFVRVDTAMLGGPSSSIAPVFAQFLSEMGTVQISANAVAGRVGVTVLPLAICALNNAPATNRSSELVEYGFRRGVPYNLMRLNPLGNNGENFLIDPIVAPGAAASVHNTSLAVVGPFVCSGKMWMPRVTGGDIQVTRPFPIEALYKHLNSRFDQYPEGLCSPNGAPPDMNVRAFTGTWMSPTQTAPHAAEYGENKLLTVAESESAPASSNMWGALWSYAKAVKYSSYQPGKPEPQAPNAGYATFATADFPTLYDAGVTTSGYPGLLAGGSPYKAFVTNPPRNKALAEENRRVLNVPLLSCPVASGTNVAAEVLAVGKFFMTEPATSTRIVAEFAGIAPAQTLVDQVELFK